MFRFTRSVVPLRTTASALLLLSAALAPGTAARAQVVYSSLAGTFTNTAAVTDFAYVDDYTTSLFRPTDPFVTTFRLGTLSFVGGPTFTGASTAANSTIRFSFLDQFGGPVSTFTQTFATSGSFLRTLDVSGLNITAATKGFFQVTTGPTTAASFEFTNAAPTIGTNDPAIGNFRNTAQPGVKAFSFSVAAAPEPGTVALVAMGLMGTAGMVIRRKKA